MEIKSKEIKIVPIENIVINSRNRNSHSEKQIDVLAKLIKLRGFRDPIIISNRTGFLVAGHCRTEAAKKLGMTELPAVYQDFDNEADEYAFLISHNEVARYAEFDKAGFQSDLQEMGLDLEALDFEEFGLLDFVPILKLEEMSDEENPLSDDMNKKYMIEVTFPNDMEMMDIHDDLTSRGYIVKVK